MKAFLVVIDKPGSAGSPVMKNGHLALFENRLSASKYLQTMNLDVMGDAKIVEVEVRPK